MRLTSVNWLTVREPGYNLGFWKAYFNDLIFILVTSVSKTKMIIQQPGKMKLKTVLVLYCKIQSVSIIAQRHV